MLIPSALAPYRDRMVSPFPRRRDSEIFDTIGGTGGGGTGDLTATNALLQNLIEKTEGGLDIPTHDRIVLTYVLVTATQPNPDLVETVTFFLDGTQLNTLTISYDTQERIVDVSTS